jgi:translation initiation factor IF-2
MAKKRVYEIAKDEGLPSGFVLQRLQRAGMPVKTASSTVDVDWALHLLNPNRHPQPATPLEVEPERPAKPVPAPAPEPEAEEPSRPKPTRPRPRPRPRTETAAEPQVAPATAPEVPAPVAAEPAPVAAAPAQPVPAAPAEEPAPAAETPTVEPAPSEAEAPALEAPPAAAEPAPAELEAAPAPAPVEEEKPKRIGPRKIMRADGTRPEDDVARPPVPAAETAPTLSPDGNGGPAPQPARPAPTEARDQDGRAARTGGTPGRGPGNGRGAGPAAPGAGTGGANRRGRPRRVVIDAQANRRGGAGPGQTGRSGGRGGTRAPEREGVPAVPVAPDLTPVDVPSGATVKDLAEALAISSAQIIKLMMVAGELVTLTQSLSDDAIELVAEELGRVVNIIHAEEEDERPETFDDAPEDLVTRAPVVTVMGHVDHGKTSLLDAVRKTEVAAGEAGGITQHIGAYQVHHGDRNVTFLDTPGHEAFTAMRARGAKITDVAIIVVAADDGVMPQTVEAIDHARAAEVPFVVAINKIDKENANPDRVRQELSTHEVIPSDWGGSQEFVNVSAHTGEGLDDLLETVLLVADADAEPKGNPNAPASGTVIESRLDPGRGPVCTVLVQRGTLHVGDVILAGEQHGRVRAMNSFNGESMTAATPSMPAEVLGLSGVPDAGDKFRIVDNERTARQLASERSQRLRAEELANRRAPVSLDDLFSRIKEGGLKELNLIVKGDVQGSVGALVDALEKVEQTEVRLRIIHTGVGAITESDVNLAAASQAIIIGFNVRPRPEAKVLAEREGVDIRTYRVIYRAIEDVRDALVGLLEPDIVEDIIGQAEVRTTFRASRLGTIAGCYILDGTVRRGAQARLLRDGTVVYEGRIGSLRRFNEDVREVSQGFECGILLDDFNDVKDGDVIEVFELREVARTAQVAAEPAE